MSAVHTLEGVAADGGQLDTFTVCAVHGQITGLVIDDEGERWQACDCHPELKSEWTSDLSMIVELCHTCASALTRAFSRFSSFHCEPHREFWVERKQRGLSSVVLGRHSVMNMGIIHHDDPEYLGEQISSMVRSIDATHDRRTALVRAVIDEPTPLVDYLEMAPAKLAGRIVLPTD